MNGVSLHELKYKFPILLVFNEDENVMNYSLHLIVHDCFT